VNYFKTYGSSSLFFLKSQGNLAKLKKNRFEKGLGGETKQNIEETSHKVTRTLMPTGILNK